MKLQNISLLRTTYPHSSTYALPMGSTSKAIDILNFRHNQSYQKGFQIIL